MKPTGFVILIALFCCHCGNSFKGEERDASVKSYSTFKSDNSKPETSFRPRDSVKTVIFIEHRLQNGNWAAIYNEQEFRFSRKADPIMNERQFAATFSYQFSRSRPLTLQITNMWTPTEDEPRKVELAFSFRSEKLVPGQVYTCTSDPKDFCNFNQGLAEFRMEMPKGIWQCQLKIETTVNLKFTTDRSRISFPSSQDPYASTGHPLSVSILCSEGQKLILTGYFLHNTETIPKL